MSQLGCDDNGFIKGFPYHDGFLDGILIDDRGKNIYLALRAASGEQRILTLRGVAAFHAEGFREGNIVLNMRILTQNHAMTDEPTRRILSERLFVDDGVLPKGARVFLLESSFGAEIVAICHDVEVTGGKFELEHER
jgi:hypothetical protein